ncbi:fibronectin type III domain-containing protein [Salipiger pacificus]|nr:fibronectin type III domain-containing protein [Alloyangia pacifica]
MRNNLRSSTALTLPQPVHAPQAVGFVLGAFGASAATAAAVGGAAAGAAATAGATFAASTIGGIVINATVGIGLSVIAQALTPAAAIAKPSVQMRNPAQPVTYAQFALGRVRNGGFLGFTEKSGKYRYNVVVIAAHPINGIVTHYIDERPVTELNVADDNGISQPDVGGKGKLWPFLGAPGQSLHPDVYANFPQLTSAHDFKGLSGCVVRGKAPGNPEHLTEYYPGEIIWAYAPVFEGYTEIYDPRTDTTGYTNNAALILAWWLTEVQGIEVDWDDVAVEADVCDEDVLQRDGVTTQKRWTINTVISDDQDFETQRAQLCAACDAFLYERPDGKAGFYVGRYIAPDVTLTDTDFWSLSPSEGQTGSSAPTEIAPEYTEPDNHYREFQGGAYVFTEAARRVRETPQLFAIDNHNQAQRVAKRIGLMKRARWKLEGSIGMIGYELIGKRFVKIEHAEAGIDAVFEIGKLARTSIGTFDITAQSVVSSDFDFDAVTEEPDRPEITEVTGLDDGVDDVTGVTAVSSAQGQITVSWDAQDEIYQQRARLTDINGDEIVLTQTQDETSLVFTGLVPGADYVVEVRNQSATRNGNWIAATPDVVTASGTAPGVLTVDTATADVGEVNFTGTAGTNTAGVIIYRATSDDFALASYISGVVPVGSFADFDITATSAAGAAYFWAVPVTAAGVEGAPVGSYSLTVT